MSRRAPSRPGRDGGASSRPGRLGARRLIAYRPPRLITDVPAPLPYTADCSRPTSQPASFLVMQPGEVAAERTFIETARRAQIVAAAIDTIAELGYAQASFARIADRVGISRGLISYHFAGKDDLIKQVVIDVLEAGRAYIVARVFAQSTGPAMLRAYIESKLAFMREQRNYIVVVVEI